MFFCSRHALSGGIAGVAFTGKMCQRDGSAVGVDEAGRYGACFSAETVAHELGHNLGSGHDRHVYTRIAYAASQGRRCKCLGFVFWR